ncbi:hypothetical protein FOIG_10639 [Fusarium odoratissimum NRRL 54006]|uniref:Uncharacterized protein n=2 Tax=Fusarium oxysporum species complex TaxID=171631 RepID=X0J6N8_FUSO5|nr:uncharacterized protein FOIG_10639 [Fusarium odoratissimum NRRL 54006]EXL96863.1 hypothetical protein FOIG_10639 [Fusarium odoratissimum NRRL 54006]TXC01524.1 hypothetical protein FocTR4_00008862 [Fusarium oxysporum f. sp. cubense]
MSNPEMANADFANSARSTGQCMPCWLDMIINLSIFTSRRLRLKDARKPGYSITTLSSLIPQQIWSRSHPPEDTLHRDIGSYKEKLWFRGLTPTSPSIRPSTPPRLQGSRTP